MNANTCVGSSYLSFLLRIFTLTILSLALSACSGSHSKDVVLPPATVTQITDAISALKLPSGPDAIGGYSQAGVPDVGDYLIENHFLKAVIDQPALDPTNLGGIFPLSNGRALTGGTLIDLATTMDNDQWNQLLQGVVAYGLSSSGSTGKSYDASNGGPAFLDSSADFTLDNVSVNDILLIHTGANAGSSYRVSAVVDPTTLGLFVPPGGVYINDLSGTISYTILRPISPLENQIVYDAADIVSADPATAMLRVTGGIRPRQIIPAQLPYGTSRDPATGRLLSASNMTPIAVETDYFITNDSKCLNLETRVINNGTSVIYLGGVSDIVDTGDFDEANLLPWTPLHGFNAKGLSSSVIVPFAGYQGRDEPGASYAIVDSIKGQIIHAADGSGLATNTQFADSKTIAANSTASWLRQVCAGDGNDIAGAADKAIELLGNSVSRVNTSDGTTQPNGYSGSVQISGSVTGAPPGTRISAIQVSPSLIFDPGMPLGLAVTPGFYSSVLAGASELIINQARPDASGNFSLKVPAGFPGLSPNATASPDITVPGGMESGTTEVVYRLLVEAPGLKSQSKIVSVQNAGAGTKSDGHVFNLSNQLATINLNITDNNSSPIPAKVIIVGMDPDGMGPSPKTPDPTLGAPDLSDTSGRADPRAIGTDNVVYLADGTGSVQVAPGAYQIIATRGLEYSAARYPDVNAAADFIMVGAGQTIVVPLQIIRILDETGLTDPIDGGSFDSYLRKYLSADFDVHTGRSSGSAIPIVDRLISYLASGVEFLVSTDTDNITDMNAGLGQLNSQTTLNIPAMIKTQVGVGPSSSVPVNISSVLESPNGSGYYSAWPLSMDNALRRNGAPADEYRFPTVLYEDLRNLGVSVIQLNHPRFPVAEAPWPPIGAGFFTNGKLGYPQPNVGTISLTAGGYDTPLRTVAAGGDGSIDDMNDTSHSVSGLTAYNDFDAIEIYTGNVVLYDIQKLDWYALTSAGYVRTATANSNSKTITDAPGFPRNFVFTSDTVDHSSDVSTVSDVTFNSTLLPSLVQPSKGTTSLVANTYYPAAPRPGAVNGAMNVLGSSGPAVFLEVDADRNGTFEGRPGDLVATPGVASDTVDVRITVLAAPWVPVDTVSLIINGGNIGLQTTGFDGSLVDLSSLLLTNSPYPVLGTGYPNYFSTLPADFIRLRDVVTVQLTPMGSKAYHSDDWISVEVRGTTGGTDPYDFIIDSMGGAANTAIGFTNPVFIDRGDGVAGGPDGLFNPPGVP